MTDRLGKIRARLEAMKANPDEWKAFHANAADDIAYLLEEVERLRDALQNPKRQALVCGPKSPEYWIFNERC